jgi:hypothetical protein
MFLCKIATFALAASTLAFGVGCAAAGTADESSTGSADLTLANPSDEGVFQLYGTPHPTRDAQCDVFTALDLTHEGARADLVAKLHEAVSGVCNVAVPDDAREYRLVLESVECGSKTYTGAATGGGALHRITLTDHRARYCRDAVPAQIVAVENVPGADARTLYSLDDADAQL